MVIIQKFSIYLSDTTVFKTITEISNFSLSEEKHTTNLT